MVASRTPPRPGSAPTAVGVLARRAPCLGGRRPWAVLVGAGQEEDVLAALAVMAGEDVGHDRRVRVADVGLVVDVVDRRGEVEGHAGIVSAGQSAARRLGGRRRGRAGSVAARDHHPLRLGQRQLPAARAHRRRVRADAAVRRAAHRHRHPPRAEDCRAPADAPARRRRRRLDREPQLDPAGTVDYLREHGVTVIGGPTADPAEHDRNLARSLADEPDLLLDNGGDLFARYLEAPWDGLRGGTEETTSGRDRLAAAARPDRASRSSSSTTARSSSSPRTRTRSGQARSRRSCGSRTASRTAGA